MNNHTIHTVCKRKKGSRVCVELFLDEDMKLIESSAPYVASAKSDARFDGSIVVKEEKQIDESNPAENSKCSSCEKQKQAEKASKAGILGRIAKGVPGLLKSELGIDRAGPSLQSERKQTCENCPSQYYDFGVCSEERGGCGCFLASKITIKGEACPEGHW